MFESVSRIAVAEQVIEQLKQRLGSGELQPGQLLPEEAGLAQALSVNRLALREALRAMEHAGLLEPLADGSLRVASKESLRGHILNMEEVLKLYAHWEIIEVRKIMECSAVTLAVRRGRPDDLQALRAAHETLCAAIDDNQRFVLTDCAFHRAVAEAAGNSMLDSLLQSTWAMTSRFNLKLLISRPERERVVEQHEKVLRAIEERNAEAAARFLAAHLEGMVDIMRRNYEQDFA